MVAFVLALRLSANGTYRDRWIFEFEASRLNIVNFRLARDTERNSFSKGKINEEPVRWLSR